jgi:hypothetical protein
MKKHEQNMEIAISVMNYFKAILNEVLRTIIGMA